MPDYQPVHKDMHVHKLWQRPSSYSFAAEQAFTPLVSGELAQAAVSLPIAFMARDSGYIPVALMSLQRDRNLFVAANGRWLGTYVPAGLRAYPFSLARTGDSKDIICVDMASGLVDEGEDGEPFFNEQGEPSRALQAVISFLQRVRAEQDLTAKACAALARLEVIAPWPIVLRTPAGEQNIQGVYRIDSRALDSLSDQAFLELRREGALFLAHSQLLSMSNMDRLKGLAQLRAKHGQNLESKGLDKATLDDGFISFS